MTEHAFDGDGSVPRFEGVDSITDKRSRNSEDRIYRSYTFG